MKLARKLDKWAYTHHPKWIDWLRIALGIIIFLKGFFFIRDTDQLIEIINQTRFLNHSFTIANYVALAHLVGGVLIAIGLLTRIAVAMQIPILLGAIIFINSKNGLMNFNSELPFSILVLVLLGFFFVYGSGPSSADEELNKEIKEQKR